MNICQLYGEYMMNLYRHLNAIRPKGRPPTGPNSDSSSKNTQNLSLAKYNKNIMKRKDDDIDIDSGVDSDGDDELREEDWDSDAEGAVGGDADNKPIICDRDDNYVNEAEVKEKVEGEDQATTTTSNSPGVAVFEAASTNTSSLNNPSHKTVETVAEDAEKEEEEKKNGLNQEEEKADEANTNNQEIGHRKV